MEKDIGLLAQRFDEAYQLRFDKEDIDWKPTLYKDKKTGQMVQGKPLAYLNWAVAWRAMKQIYPDANYRLVEDQNGNVLWNVNGYGMLKCAVSACGVEHIENFPIMQGGRNDAMKMEEIDGRDVNDSAQRGFTKAIARFGIGLYIYEGKLQEDGTVKSSSVRIAPRQAVATKAEVVTDKPVEVPTGDMEAPKVEKFHEEVDSIASPKQLNYIAALLTQTGMSPKQVEEQLRVKLNRSTTTRKQAMDVITFLKAQKIQPKEAPREEDKIKIEDEDLPF